MMLCPPGTWLGQSRTEKSSAPPAGQKGALRVQDERPGLSTDHIPTSDSPRCPSGTDYFRSFRPCQCLCPSPRVIQLPVSVFYFQSRAGLPGPPSSTLSLEPQQAFPSIQPG